MVTTRQLRVVSCGTEDRLMDTAVKVAFASSDMQQVDQHFGAAEAFVVYAVDADSVHLVAVTQFGQLVMDGNEAKLGAKIDALDGCIAVYANAIGASAVAQLKMHGVQPVKVSPGALVSVLIDNLQTELRAGPSVWLARALAQAKPKTSERFTAMLNEGWEE